MIGTRQTRYGRARMLVVGTLLLVGAVGACRHGESVGKTGVAWLDAPAEPVDVQLTFDSSHAVSRVISEKGGTLSTMGDGGTFFTLVIPRGALAGRERITMIPVRHVDGLPLKDGAIAAVQLEPEGLRLEKPATLTIETEHPVALAERVAFAYVLHGRDTHLYPGGGDSLETELKLLHFSGYGFGAVAPGDPGRTHLLYASAHEARLEAKIAEAIAAEKSRDPNGTSNDASNLGEMLMPIMLEYYDGILRPTMKIAETDDRMAQCAMQFYLGWLRQLQLLGMAPEGAAGMPGETGDPALLQPGRGGTGEIARRMEEASASAVRIFLNVEQHLMERAQEGCRQHDLTAYSRVIGFYRQVELLGGRGVLSKKNFDFAAWLEAIRTQCWRFDIELVSGIEGHTPHYRWGFEVKSTVPYVPPADANGAAGGENDNTGPLNYVRSNASGRPTEDFAMLFGGKPKGTHDMADALRNTVEFGMNFDVSVRGTRHGTVRVVGIELGKGRNVRDTVGVTCSGQNKRDADSGDSVTVYDTVLVTLRVDPPTEITHFEPVHHGAGAPPPSNADMHEWMRFFTQFRKRAGNTVAPPPEAAGMDAFSGEQPQILTVQVVQQEPGVWRAEFTTPDDGKTPGTSLSETGYLLLRHTPAT